MRESGAAGTCGRAGEEAVIRSLSGAALMRISTADDTPRSSMVGCESDEDTTHDG